MKRLVTSIFARLLSAAEWLDWHTFRFRWFRVWSWYCFGPDEVKDEDGNPYWGEEKWLSKWSDNQILVRSYYPKGKKHEPEHN